MHVLVVGGAHEKKSEDVQGSHCEHAGTVGNMEIVRREGLHQESRDVGDEENERHKGMGGQEVFSGGQGQHVSEVIEHTDDEEAQGYAAGRFHAELKYLFDREGGIE